MAETPTTLARLAHDIRGPLSVILSYASLLDEGAAGPLTAEQREMVADMLTSAKEIATAIDRAVAGDPPGERP